MKRIILSFGIALSAAFAQDADTVLINGKILTADQKFTVQQALAVRDGKITALGTKIGRAHV